MTEVKPTSQNLEVTRNYITNLLEQLTLDEQNTKKEQQEINSLFPALEEEFTILEEIELLTVNIRGYASQIKVRGWIEEAIEAIEQLQSMRVFDIPAIAQFYFATNDEYGQIKAYLRMLDYLRLLMIEYLCCYQNLSQKSA